MKSFPVSCLLLSIFLNDTLALLPSPHDGKINVSETTDKKKLKIKQSDIEDAIEFASRVTEYLERFESTIREPSRMVPNSPAHALFSMYEPDWRAVKRGRQAHLALRSSLQLAYGACHEQNIDLYQCNIRIRRLSFASSSLRFICQHLNKKCSPEEKLSPYRSIDGTCNHLNKASLGESYTAYSRYMYPQYLNYLDSPKRSVTKLPMPIPREVSNTFIKNIDNPHEYLTLAFTLWGQFIAHDLSRFSSSIMTHYNDSFRCCDDNGFNMAPRYTHPSCMPISISANDKYYNKHYLQCMDYVRSTPALRPDCSLGNLEQQNQATHYLDGSQIYGTTLGQSFKLQEMKNGKLLTSEISNQKFLPLMSDAKQHCRLSSPEDVCFYSADPRVNFFPQLTVLHTIWVREHNRLTEELAQLNKEWDDEALYQEARRIVIAEMQHITYNEWIQHALDEQSLSKLEKVNKYNENIDPSISNVFASAAIRTLFSMIPGEISVVDTNYSKNETIRMQNYYNKPTIVTERFESLLGGMISQQSKKIGIHYSEDLTNNLFANEAVGYDLLSLDIQRGRDHGLPGYNAYRKLCGLKKVSRFEEFSDVMLKTNALLLSKIYKHVDDVDLIIGGLLESPVNSLWGPTLSCIIGDQFMRTKQADRYFYTYLQQPKPFTDLQLQEIQKVTLARIFCDNSDLENIPPKVFEVISETNKPIDCSIESIPRLSLLPWLEDREKYIV